MPINYRNYHAQWPLIRAIISHRDRNKCKRCRAPHLVMIWRMHNRTWTPYVRPQPPQDGKLWRVESGVTKSYLQPQEPPGARKLILCVCTVAHLDWDRENNAHANLALLCQQCHLDHDRSQHLYRRLRSKLSRAAQYELFPVGKPVPAEI